MAEVSSKELYKFKKTLKELSEKKGRGTELVSVYIPHDKQISDVGKQMRDELGQSANIKSKQTRKNVQSAIEVIMQRIRLFKVAPENGLVLFVGMIPRGGPGFTKEEFVKGDYLNYEIKDKIIATVDTSYTGEFGIREVIDKSADILNDLDVMQEKKVVQKFLHELVKDKGLASYGEREVRTNLIMGAVDTLLLSEDLTAMRKVFKCPSCGSEEEITVKSQSEADKLEKPCSNCGEILKEESSQTLIEDFVEKAEEMNSEVELISTETEEGMQLLRAFGGVAAILRYHVG